MKTLMIAVVLIFLLAACGTGIDQQVEFDKYSDCCGELFTVKTYVYGHNGFANYFIQESFYDYGVLESEIPAIKKEQENKAKEHLELLNKCQSRKKEDKADEIK